MNNELILEGNESGDNKRALLLLLLLFFSYYCLLACIILPNLSLQRLHHFIHAVHLPNQSGLIFK
jgi:hypothetical protein